MVPETIIALLILAVLWLDARWDRVPPEGGNAVLWKQNCRKRSDRDRRQP